MLDEFEFRRRGDGEAPTRRDVSVGREDSHLRAADVRALLRESKVHASDPKLSRKSSPIRNSCAERSAHLRGVLHAVSARSKSSTGDELLATRASYALYSVVS